MASNLSVLGIYPDRTTVSDAINVLQKAGYRATDISVLSSDNQGSKDFGLEPGTRALEGAATGAAAGAAITAALAWLVSVQTVSPSRFAFLATAGPLLAALAGAGVGGALGWILGLIAGSRVTQYIARRYAGRIRRGGILLSVHCDGAEWCHRAMKTLKDTGARSISCAKQSAADYGTTDKPTERSPILVTDRVVVPAPPPGDYVAVEPKE
ncbi:MAG TPA: hypothetical protein VKU19_31810 [Bryobacteraceae bacterium]|nr:hypothetical protein [Bryobacteraceae bacterium]